jgi:hypothetical protein
VTGIDTHDPGHTCIGVRIHMCEEFLRELTQLHTMTLPQSLESRDLDTGSASQPVSLSGN